MLGERPAALLRLADIVAVSRGDTFLVPSGPDGNHLFVVCTGETSNGMRLLVSFSSVKPGRHFDDTCILEVGEHPFVSKQSYIAYGKALSRSTLQIEACIEKGTFIPKEPVSEELLERIVEGFEDSNFVQPWVFEILNDQAED